MPDFTLTNGRPRTAAPSSFVSNERTKQTLLLSGLDCLPGQLDLFDVDAFPKETEPCDRKSNLPSDSANC
jgi:hypothetical protein